MAAVTRATTLSEHKVYPNGFVLATFPGSDRQPKEFTGCKVGIPDKCRKPTGCGFLPISHLRLAIRRRILPVDATSGRLIGAASCSAACQRRQKHRKAAAVLEVANTDCKLLIFRAGDGELI